MNLCILGFSGSGKTCYLHTACHVLSRGVNVDNHTFSITCTDRFLQDRLNQGVEQLANGQWPEGDLETVTYPFEFNVDGKAMGQFNIYDYRGGALDGHNDDDQSEANLLFDTFQDSNCIVFLIDGDTMVNALGPENLAQEHIDRNDPRTRLQARNSIQYIRTILHECDNRMNGNSPILLCITKKDIFTDNELEAGYQLLHNELREMFAQNNERVVGICSVTLGQGLQNIEENQLIGNLWLNTDGNLHIPILFALLQHFDQDNRLGNDRETRKAIYHLFPEDRLLLYRNGETAVII